jgi:hypothetical protein
MASDGQSKRHECAGQTDYAARARRAFMDNDKLSDAMYTECGELIPADFGWWGFMSYQPGSYYSTTPDDVEYHLRLSS